MYLTWFWGHVLRGHHSCQIKQKHQCYPYGKPFHLLYKENSVSQRMEFFSITSPLLSNLLSSQITSPHLSSQITSPLLSNHTKREGPMLHGPFPNDHNYFWVKYYTEMCVCVCLWMSEREKKKGTALPGRAILVWPASDGRCSMMSTKLIGKMPTLVPSFPRAHSSPMYSCSWITSPSENISSSSRSASKLNRAIHRGPLQITHILHILPNAGQFQLWNLCGKNTKNLKITDTTFYQWRKVLTCWVLPAKLWQRLWVQLTER